VSGDCQRPFVDGDTIICENDRIALVGEGASLTDMPAALCICAATGSNARVYRLNPGLLSQGRDADIIQIDAPSGGSQETALAAINNGDVPAVCAVVAGDAPRLVGRARSTLLGRVRFGSRRAGFRPIFPVEGAEHERRQCALA
jgi:hypothetical protein